MSKLHQTAAFNDISKLITEEPHPQYSTFPTPHPSSLMSNSNDTAPTTNKTTSPRDKGLFLSLVLENKGSTARDHLANERTFLAWLRTSLALVTIGIAVTQFSKLSRDPPNSPEKEFSFHLILGSLYMIIGILFVFAGLTRYFYIQSQLIQGKFPASRYTIILGVLLLLIISATLVYTFIGDVFF